MRWFPALLAASLAASLPRLAAASPDEPTEPEATRPAASEAGEAAEVPSDEEEQPEAAEAEPGTRTASPRAAAAVEEPAAPEPPPIPPALDTLGGHFALSPSIGVVLPFGNLANGTPSTSILGTGAGYGVEIGYGVSRSVMLGAWGQYAHAGAGSACARCSASSFAVGPFLRYHLVQGMRFDPWMEAGLGFRSMHLDNPDAQIAGVPAGGSSWSGIDWVHVSVGGDWYAFSNVGFGPFMSLDVSTFGSRPSTAGASTAAWQFSTGARITFDLPGK